MAVTLKIRRGLLSGLPAAAAGEPLYTTDQPRLYVGASGGNQLLAVLNKIDGTTAPTVNDDAGDGYSVGSVWTDTTNDKSYICSDSTVGAAVWQQFSGTGTGGITQLTGDVTAGPGTGSQAATIGANKVVDSMLRTSAGLSVVGRSGNTTGNVADITAASDGNVLRRSGTALGFGAIDLTSSGAVSGILGSVNGGTANGFTKFSGPTTSEKTFTLPNSSATILTSASAVTETQGGTNQTTYTLGDLLYASAANTLSKLGGNTAASKKWLYQTGSGTVSAAPAWAAIEAGDIASGQLSTARLPGGDWIGATNTGSTGGYVITAASGTWVGTGLTFTVSAAGKYLIAANIRGEVQPATTGAHFISAKFYNVTSGFDLTDVIGGLSEVMVCLSNQNGVLATTTASMTGVYNLSTSTTYELYVKRSGTTFTSSQLLNDTNGRTKFCVTRVY